MRHKQTEHPNVSKVRLFDGIESRGFCGMVTPTSFRGFVFAIEVFGAYGFELKLSKGVGLI